MALRNQLTVRKKNGAMRSGRGFSREELKKAGVGLRQALRAGLPVDTRRRTVHEENLELIKQQIKVDIPKSGKKPRKKQRKGSKS